MPKEGSEHSHSLMSPKAKKSLLSSTTKYLRGRSKSPGPLSSRTERTERPTRSKSEKSRSADPAPDSPVSAKLDKKIKKKKDKEKLKSIETQSTANSSLSPSTPGTPKAKAKIKRISVPPNLLDTSDAVSLPTENAVSARKGGKKKRRSSLGALEEKVKVSDREERKAKRALERKSKSGRSVHDESDGVQNLMDHLGGGGEALLQSPMKRKVSLRGEVIDEVPMTPRTREKQRTTVDDKGRISRTPKKKSISDANDSDGSSKVSKASKSSKASRSSKTSRASRMSSGSKMKKKSSKKLLRDGEDTPENSRDRRAELRGGKKPTSMTSMLSPDGLSEHETNSTVSSLPKFNGFASPKTPRKSYSVSSGISDLSSKEKDDDESDGSAAVETVAALETKLALKEKEIESLNKTIVQIKEDQLKIQFDSQSEVSKVRRELRDEKLLLQQSDLERRELRAELKEQEKIIDESDRKIQALEKAVESQLDKVDELEDELKRANEEIFDLEEKMVNMEAILADVEAGVNGEGQAKEREMDNKRRERLERRLDEREKKLEERERQLLEEREHLSKQGNSSGEVEQLEQDNRMLLKALNREKAEAAELAKNKDAELEDMRKRLKEAKMRSYSSVMKPAGEETDAVSKVMKEKHDLEEQLRAEKQIANAALQKKDDSIAFLELELRRLKGDESQISGGLDHIKRELEASRTESQVMKSKFDGAQRRNQILEDEIDHWKQVNCSLEDELAEWKSQAAQWRAKYENVVDEEEGDTQVEPAPSILPFSLSSRPSRGGPPIEIGFNASSYHGSSFHGTSHHGGQSQDDDASVSSASNTISNLWSKLTTPTQKKPTLNANGLQDAMIRTTFH